MPIVGFNFKKILAEKKNQIQQDTQIKINSKLGITDLNKEELPTGKTKSEGLRMDFEFTLDYEPEIAKIDITGFIYYLDDPSAIKDIIKGWDKNKNIPLDIKRQAINTIILKSTIRALALEQEINIPPHMPFPSVEPAKEQQKQKSKKEDEYIG